MAQDLESPNVAPNTQDPLPAHTVTHLIRLLKLNTHLSKSIMLTLGEYTVTVYLMSIFLLSINSVSFSN